MRRELAVLRGGVIDDDCPLEDAAGEKTTTGGQ